MRPPSDLRVALAFAAQPMRCSTSCSGSRSTTEPQLVTWTITQHDGEKRNDTNTYDAEGRLVTTTSQFSPSTESDTFTLNYCH
jgi:hypothetical protein